MTQAKPPTASLHDTAARAVELAKSRGADTAEASAGAGWELSTRVRNGEPELVEEAGQRGVSLRVIKDQRVAMTSTSDLSKEGLERCVADALSLARLSEPDPYAGPAESSLLASPPYPDLDLFDESIAAIDADRALDWAKRTEAAALSHDSRISLSEGATFGRVSSTQAIVLSSGFSGTLRGTYASLSVAPVAQDQGNKNRRGHYWTAHRHLSELEDPEAVGREAASRTVAKLGARRVSTSEAPVIFHQDMASSVIGTFAGCLLGGALWRQASYLAERLETQVASPLVTLVDDPLMPRAPGSRPFDGEGLLCRRNVVVQSGALSTFLLDCYSARKLGRQPTASASRSGGAIGASTSNFVMQAGSESEADIVRSTERGLYVTEMMGFGFNAVTGDFSRAAAGFWIENGQLQFPVSEVTISCNLDRMLKSIDKVGNELSTKTSTVAPCFRISSMTIGGS